jgi:hypothetical protein
VCFGGVHGEVPYEKERMVSSIYSLPQMKEEVENLAVNLSDYHGGASIGSYICKRAGEIGIEFVSLYAFSPTYDFSNIAQAGNAIRIETDYMAWLGVMRRVNFMLKLDINLSELEEKSEQLIQMLDARVNELESSAPQLEVKEYLKSLSEEFTEISFNPLDEVWEDEIRRLLNKYDTDDMESDLGD